MLLVGIVLLLWAWGIWLYRTSVAPVAVAPLSDSPDTTASRRAVVQSLPAFLAVGFVLLLALFVGTYLITRWARRLRERQVRRSAAPTDSRDVWQMHRLPRDEEG